MHGVTFHYFTDLGQDHEEVPYQQQVPVDKHRVVRYSFADNIQGERQFDQQREVSFQYQEELLDEILECEYEKAKSAERRKQMTLRRWFKQPQLYQVQGKF